ncbi:MAG: hypothetical protein ACLTF6_01330 [Clostridium sp.]
MKIEIKDLTKGISFRTKDFLTMSWMWILSGGQLRHLQEAVKRNGGEIR